MSGLNGLRIFWIAWCGMWALFWLIAGFFTVVGFLGVPISLAAILFIMIPDPPKPRQIMPPPPCFRCGAPFGEHWYGRCPPRPAIGPPDISVGGR